LHLLLQLLVLHLLLLQQLDLIQTNLLLLLFLQEQRRFSLQLLGKLRPYLILLLALHPRHLCRCLLSMMRM
jgi:hypothetical protein